MFRNKSWITLFALLVLCTGLNAGAAEIASLDVGQNGVLWTPTGDAAAYELVVSGPTGVFTQVFRGEQPALSIFNAEGGTLVDGRYTWELRAIPELGEARVTMLRAREEGALLGRLPQDSVQFGYLAIVDGRFVTAAEEAATPSAPAGAEKAQVFTTDLIVEGSACIGVDCTSSESFGFDTIRLKENNLRIKFLDTSASASFPGNDWQLVANDSSNGGAERFSIEDVTGNKTPFTVIGGAPSNSMYVDAAGNLGLGTASPVVEAHIADGDSPTLRLEQNGSSGFQTQIWDLAGNETNFFVRDVTNGSKLPFKIIPNAPTNSLYVAASGNVGLGTTSPDANLHSIGGILVSDSDSGEAPSELLEIESSTDNTARLRFNDGTKWNIGGGTGNTFFMSDAGDGSEFTLTGDGNLTISGTLTTASTTYPDYVFKDDYNLLSLDEVASFIEANGHLPNVPSETEVLANGSRVDITQLSHTLLEKVEELTLYTLQQHETIKELQAQVEALQGN